MVATHCVNQWRAARRRLITRGVRPVPQASSSTRMIRWEIRGARRLGAAKEKLDMHAQPRSTRIPPATFGHFGVATLGLVALALGSACGSDNGGALDLDGAVVDASTDLADASTDDTDASADDTDASAGELDAGELDAGELDAGEDVECGANAECDDGIACTVGICSAEGECSFDPDDALCDDDNECTINTCDGEEGCSAEDVDDGEPCAGGTGTCQSGVCEGEESDVVGFRADSLVLQHPHLILEEPEFNVCDDVTFDPLVVLGTEVSDGLNPSIAEQIDDLELNFVDVFDPFAQDDEHVGGNSLFDAECTSPTSCEPADDGELAVTTFEVQRDGSCLDSIPGLFEGEWPDGRTTDPNSPSAGDSGCFLTEPTFMDLQVEFSGEEIALPLRDGQIAGRFGADPAATLADGVIIGFLTQEDADDIDLIFDTDFGTFTYNLGEDLLPADGQGVAGCEPRTHCDGPDARVTHDGQCGWWFVFNFTGQRIDDATDF